MSLNFNRRNSKKIQIDASYPTNYTHYSDSRVGGGQNKNNYGGGGGQNPINFCFDHNLDLIGEEKESIKSSPQSDGSNQIMVSLKRSKSHNDFNSESKSFLLPVVNLEKLTTPSVPKQRTEALSKIQIM